MLEVEKLNQYYGGSHTLRHVSLTLPERELTVVLGRNGVGKTTLLRCLMGVLPVRSGVIRWRGKEITGLPPYARVNAGFAYVPQGRDIFPRLTVEENLLVGAAARRGRKEIPPLIYDLFPVLKQMRSRLGGNLSGGQQQQLAIGRALMSKPELLILDEPTEGIQPSIIQDIGRTLRRLVEDLHLTVLLVEQYFEFARAIADHYLVMDHGEVVAQGAGANLETDGVRQMISV
ncbi:MAG: urea ABC transporter ATP-binding subunit UrtE [Verrucomicrobia bacterium]|nr:urea ABC transporter ATP-binding subunit UrtE [Verrucomicrobiota bacterium]